MKRYVGSREVISRASAVFRSKMAKIQSVGLGGLNAGRDISRAFAVLSGSNLNYVNMFQLPRLDYLCVVLPQAAIILTRW